MVKANAKANAKAKKDVKERQHTDIDFSFLYHMTITSKGGDWIFLCYRKCDMMHTIVLYFYFCSNNSLHAMCKENC